VIPLYKTEALIGMLAWVGNSLFIKSRGIRVFTSGLLTALLLELSFAFSVLFPLVLQCPPGITF
jgi:hypothetical protein